MSVPIVFMTHPTHGPVWYGCVFGIQEGKPYLIECRYHAKPEDRPGPDGKPPHPGIVPYIVEQLAARATRHGIRLESYAEKDLKCERVAGGKLRRAARSYGSSPAQAILPLLRAQQIQDLSNLFSNPTGPMQDYVNAMLKQMGVTGGIDQPKKS